MLLPGQAGGSPVTFGSTGSTGCSWAGVEGARRLRRRLTRVGLAAVEALEPLRVVVGVAQPGEPDALEDLQVVLQALRGGRGDSRGGRRAAGLHDGASSRLSGASWWSLLRARHLPPPIEAHGTGTCSFCDASSFSSRDCSRSSMEGVLPGVGSALAIARVRGLDNMQRAWIAWLLFSRRLLPAAPASPAPPRAPLDAPPGACIASLAHFS